MWRAVWLYLLAPIAAHADSSVVVTLNAQGQQFAMEYGQSEQMLIMRAQNAIETIYQTQNLAGLLRAFANTAAFSDRGVGADYQADPNDISVAAAATGALPSDVSLGGSTHVVYGAVVDVGAVAGVSLARWGAPRWAVYANADFEDTTIHGLKGTLISGGAHAQYKVIAGGEPSSVRWTGVDLTSGLDVAQWHVGAAAPIKINFKVVSAVTGEVKIVDLASTGKLDVLATTYTIPLEVTTGVRFWNTLGVYGGGGIDVIAGHSEIDASLSGDLTINSNNLPIGTAVITASGRSTPDPITVHALGGIEVHTTHVRVFAQGALAPDEEAVTFGVRAAM